MAPITLPTLIQPVNLMQLYQKATIAADIQDAMSLGQFLNQPERVIEDTENEQAENLLLQEILEEHLQTEPPEYEDDVENLTVEPNYSVHNAEHTLRVQPSFKEKQSTDLKIYLKTGSV
ncbi:hypothetical protein GcM3_090030 [Golovinomyces cichoracearum]|uniref:Uncharacterized protein n=1 Tax=Golovinomyces cichoracearum TaxID=62708 RepID=A0A420II46_9PEZI|nr:hypothetical protein GcM3_090030 [Golovinomyces cichoracearum]